MFDCLGCACRAAARVWAEGVCGWSYNCWVGGAGEAAADGCCLCSVVEEAGPSCLVDVFGAGCEASVDVAEWLWCGKDAGRLALRDRRSCEAALACLWECRRGFRV